VATSAAETRLVRAARDKGAQLSMLAHELRNPLGPLRNGIEIVRQMSVTNPALARTAEMMGRQLAQLVRVADDLVGQSTPVVEELPPTAAPPGESFRLKILVVDDNSDGADSLASLLQAQGHVVLTATDGRRAVDLSEGFRPDVIPLMDLAMPHLDGLAATREIRSRPWGARGSDHRTDGMGAGRRPASHAGSGDGRPPRKARGPEAPGACAALRGTER
jgi:CheY-like chemotaxis protein